MTESDSLSSGSSGSSGAPLVLAPRFQEPEGWRWHSFRNADGKTLRFGSVFPEGKPRAVVVILPGLSEFCEKYFEVARDLLARGCAVWVIDWRGQGRSDRYLANPHKRHSEGFEKDLADLERWIGDYVRPSAGAAPMVMLAHSMGGNIGMRYLMAHPRLFRAAAFSAPMIGVRALRHVPGGMALFLARLFGGKAGARYVPGGRDWAGEGIAAQARGLLSSDPERGAVHDLWMARDESLRIGAATFGWLRAAYLSSRAVQAGREVERIGIPVLFVLAGQEGLVDNRATRRLAARMKRATVREIAAARHEILMEKDPIRAEFFQGFDALLAEAVSGAADKTP